MGVYERRLMIVEMLSVAKQITYHSIPKSGCFLLPKMPGADFSFFHLTPRNSILSNISGLG